MARVIPVAELEFLKLTANHRELGTKLSSLGCKFPELDTYANAVCRAWFRLGQQHLREAKRLSKAGCRRAAFSRAYYAAYNASKSARYLVKGWVSLKGDDHGRASAELPGDFPDIAHWSAQITELYENRLRADYDNWLDTGRAFTVKPEVAVATSAAFVRAVRDYLGTKFGLQL